MVWRLSTELGEETEEIYEPSKATRLFIVWRKLKKNRLAIVGGGIVLLVVGGALLAPMIAPYDPLQLHLGKERLPPSREFLFGTDNLGRDVFSWIVWGTRTSLYVGLAAVLIEVLVGLGLGMIAGYFGGKLDEILMRITDVVLCLPTILLLIVTLTMFEERGVNVIIMVMGAIGWPFMARVVRSEFLSLRESTYVEAAKSIGATNWRIMLRHILPNMLSTIIVLATMDIPWYIFYEAELTFLGFGDPLTVSWGILMELGRPYLRSAWWITAFPGAVIFLVSLGFNLLGDGLRDALDVKTRV